MNALRRDLRDAIRGVRGTPRLSVVAAACVALGIGGTVFILTVADAVLHRAPPFPDADRLVRVWTVADRSTALGDVSYLDARDISDRSTSFDAFELVARTRLALDAGDGTERVRGESITAGYLSLIGITPALGRAFTPGEYAPGADRVIILGHGLWMRRFGGSPDVVGRTVRARGTHGREPDQLFTIVGVMPPGFVGTVDPDVSEFWLPIEQYSPRAILERRTSRGTWVLARLRAGTSLEAAQAEVGRIGTELRGEHPAAYEELSLLVEPVGERWRARYRDGLYLLAAAAALLLLIACTNVAHLLLARLAQRGHELRVRIALGAGRGTIIRQLFGESVLISAAGGVAGVAAGLLGVRVFAASGVLALPPYVTYPVDVRVVLASLVITATAAVVAGTLPAWLGGRLTADGVGQLARGTSLGRGERRSVNAVVAAEVAFTFVLLVGAALMLRSYGNLLRTDTGYRTAGLLRMAISLDASRYPDAESQLAFARETGRALSERPRVRAVSVIAGVLPPWFDETGPLSVGAEPVASLSSVQRHAVDERFFEVLDVALLAGRTFTTADRTGSPSVAVVSQSVARILAGGDGLGAVGRSFELVPDGHTSDRPAAGPPRAIEVVGVVEDLRYHGPLSPRPLEADVYQPLAQAPGRVLSIAIHTDGDPNLVRLELMRALGRLAPTSPLHWISTMDEELAGQYRDARLYAWLTGAFGLSALLLVVTGVYGVISHAVARRSNELGVRIAVGATPLRILSLVLRQALRPVAVGIVTGALLAAATATVVEGLVYGVAPTDALTFIVVAGGLLVLGVAASLLPARRATRLDPVSVLWR